MNKRHFLRVSACACAAAALLTGPVAQAQDFPLKKPLTIVVGFAAGGAADAAARLIGKKLGDQLGVPVIIDNKAGAGGNIAHQYVAKSAPTDGSVILFGSVGPLAIAPHLMKLPYDPVKDLAPITMGVNFPNVLVVGADTKIKTFAEFLAYAKANPGKLEYASTGAGSASHLAGELMDDMAKIDTVHVPYKGGAPALQDLLGGRVAMYYSTLNTSQPHIQTGRLVPLASNGPKRLPQLPNVPTIAESGFPGYSATNWYAFVASSKVPAPILDRWNTEIVKVLKDPSVEKALSAHGLTPQPTSRAEFAAFMKKEYEQWGRLVKERKLSAE